jgi:hypothetical protein
MFPVDGPEAEAARQNDQTPRQTPIHDSGDIEANQNGQGCPSHTFCLWRNAYQYEKVNKYALKLASAISGASAA